MLCLQIFVFLLIFGASSVCEYSCIFPWLGDGLLGYSVAVVYGLISLLLFYCYWKSCFTSPGHPPKDWTPEGVEMDTIEADAVERGTAGPPPVPKARHCTKCKAHKPPRTHHCSICRKCVLRMDHHCPWINNCVGFHNYKFFLLFLVYTTIISAATILFLIGRTFFCEDPLTAGQAAGMWMVGMSAVPVFIMVTCLLVYHINLISSNYTTIESHSASYQTWGREKAVHKYDLGTMANLYAVLGPRVWLWLVPVPIPGDGLSYPVQEDKANLVESSTAI